jgi:chromosomal replication initiator protein
MTQKNPINPYVFPGLKFSEIDLENNPFIRIINRRITEDELFEIVENKSGFTKENLISPSRKRELVDMRQLVSFVLKTDFNRTLASIGELLGDRDHTTILHSIRKFYDLYETNIGYKNTCDSILKLAGIKTDNIV